MEWALDFASDFTAAGQRFRVLAVSDRFTCQCLVLETANSGSIVSHCASLNNASRFFCPMTEGKQTTSLRREYFVRGRTYLCN